MQRLILGNDARDEFILTILNVEGLEKGYKGAGMTIKRGVQTFRAL